MTRGSAVDEVPAPPQRVDRARVDEHDLPPLVAHHVGVGEVGERQEQRDVVVLAAVVAVVAEGVDRREVDPGHLGLLGQLADRRLGVGLPVLDAAADQRPLVGVDRRVLVALLEQQPAARVDQDDGGDASAHAAILTERGRRPSPVPRERAAQGRPRPSRRVAQCPWSRPRCRARRRSGRRVIRLA